MKNLINLSADLLRLFYPSLCLICRHELLKQEYLICATCGHQLPETGFHRHPSNPVKEKFPGNPYVKQASAVYYFQKESPMQYLLHQLKYHHKPKVGCMLGNKAAHALADCSWLNQADYLLPVPLADKRMKERGYNQAERLAFGLSEVSRVPMLADALLRTKDTATQTSLHLTERMENVRGAFTVSDAGRLQGCNVVLIDDVLTTGATMRSCVQTLSSIPEIEIHVLTLCFAMI